MWPFVDWRCNFGTESKICIQEDNTMPLAIIFQMNLTIILKYSIGFEHLIMVVLAVNQYLECPLFTSQNSRKTLYIIKLFIGHFLFGVEHELMVIAVKL